MRKLLVPVTLVFLAVVPGAAFAATAAPVAASQADQSTSGVIKFFSSNARSIELADGSWYFLPLDFKAPDLKAGDKVTVHWHNNGSAHDVTGVDIG